MESPSTTGVPKRPADDPPAGSPAPMNGTKTNPIDLDDDTHSASDPYLYQIYRTEEDRETGHEEAPDEYFGTWDTLSEAESALREIIAEQQHDEDFPLPIGDMEWGTTWDGMPRAVGTDEECVKVITFEVRRVRAGRTAVDMRECWVLMERGEVRGVFQSEAGALREKTRLERDGRGGVVATQMRVQV